MRFLLFVLVSSFSFSLFAQDTVVFGEVGATSAVGVSLNVEQKVAGPFAIQAGLGLTPHRYSGTPGVIIPLRLSVTLGSSRIRPEVSLGVLLVPVRVYSAVPESREERVIVRSVPTLFVGVRRVAKSGAVGRSGIALFGGSGFSFPVVPWRGFSVGYGF